MEQQPTEQSYPGLIHFIGSFLPVRVRDRLLVFFILIALLPAILISIVSVGAGLGAGQQRAVNQLQSVAALKEAEINTWLQNLLLDLNMVRRQDDAPLRMQTLLTSPRDTIGYRAGYLAQQAAFQQALELRPTFAELFIVDLQGKVLLSSAVAQEGSQVANQLFFIEGQKGAYISAPVVPSALGQATLVVAHPIENETGDVIGVLGGRVGLATLNTIMLERAGLGETGETYLVDETYLPITDLRFMGDTMIDTEGAKTAVAGKTTGSGLYRGYRGVSVIGVYRWLPQMHVALLAEQDQSEAFRDVYALLGLNVGVALVAVLLTALASIFIARSISAPLSALVQTATLVAKGDLSQMAYVPRSYEIGSLARTFNSMTIQLRMFIGGLEKLVQERTSELEERVEQLGLINRVGQRATSLLDPNALMFEITRLIRETFGYYAVFYFEVDGATGELVVRAGDTLEMAEFLGMRVAMSEGVVGYVARTGEPLVVSDVSADERFRFEAQLPEARSEIALPMRIGEQVLGVLDLQSVQLNTFQEEDIRVFRTLADQLAIAIQNARLFQDAQDARLEAEEANQLKSQFLANMSHELRTPLNSIINFAYLLNMGVEGTLSVGQADLINRIEESGRHLLDLINDILDLSKIESGRMELFFERVGLPEMVRSVMATAVSLIREKPIELETRLEPGLPLVYADRTRVRQILLNMISNAAKFTEEGRIVVGATADANWMMIFVQDTGIGIAAEDIPKAFLEFVQIDGRLTRRAGGTGLGLAISKRFVELHGGRIWAESTPGEGSTFYFTLPVSAESRAEPLVLPREPALVRSDEIHVLVVDDDPNMLDIVESILEGEGFYRVSGANTGSKGLELIREERPDVVVLDLMMPELSGFEVLTAVRADPTLRHLPVLITSAKELTTEEKHLLQSNGAIFMQKGAFSIDDFAQTIETALQEGIHERTSY